MGIEMKYNFQTDFTLQKIKETIIKAVSPKKIILFGSRARGEVDNNSDYDILVIKDNIKNERDISRRINYELLNEHIESDVEILATSTEKWNKHKDNIAFIYKNINAESLVLYER